MSIEITYHSGRWHAVLGGETLKSGTLAEVEAWLDWREHIGKGFRYLPAKG